jgi:acid phosphatase (class A)
VRRSIAHAALVFLLSTGLSSTYASPPQIAATPYYLSVDAMRSFEAKPVELGSPTDQEDMKALKAAQLKRTKADCERAAAEALPVNPAYQEFFGAIGPFSTPLRGAEREFIIHVWSDASLVSEIFKKKYKWPRAYAIDATIEPCLEKTTSPAFPSGHTLVSRVFALTLSDIDPRRRSVYLSRADEVANDRLLAGMHRSSELAASKSLADQIYAKLLKSEAFQHDLAKMKALVNEKTGTTSSSSL